MTRAALTVVLVAAVLGWGVGCRADEDQCRALAAHVAEIASAEGKAGAGTAAALEADCQRLEPTQGLVECMMAAESLAELDGC